jgi:hypothetical protein
MGGKLNQRLRGSERLLKGPRGAADETIIVPVGATSQGSDGKTNCAQRPMRACVC